MKVVKSSAVVASKEVPGCSFRGTKLKCCDALIEVLGRYVVILKSTGVLVHRISTTPLAKSCLEGDDVSSSNFDNRATNRILQEYSYMQIQLAKKTKLGSNKTHSALRA